MNNSDFFVTLTGEHLSALDGKHTIFGYIADGLENLEKLNRIHVDQADRPLVNIRIYHTHILEDPYDDPAGFPESPISSPVVQPNVGQVDLRP